ncbi:transposase [Paraburkholderia sp. BL6669N2]|uniref:transposase n=1 Tax=Paraburkholderia sp. BL6669N2 TaxID=1938807 RepID=UPI0038D511C4
MLRTRNISSTSYIDLARSFSITATKPTLTLSDAIERLERYARRWTIESSHRVLKNGCCIDARHFGNLELHTRYRVIC